MQNNIPHELQGVLWSKELSHIDLEQDKVYVIHQILSYGNLSHIKWLFSVYGRKGVQEVFLSAPKKLYERHVFYFIKDIILSLGAKPLNESLYVKSSS